MPDTNQDGIWRKHRGSADEGSGRRPVALGSLASGRARREHGTARTGEPIRAVILICEEREGLDLLELAFDGLLAFGRSAVGGGAVRTGT